MANFYNRADREKRDLFDAPDNADLSSNSLDLPSKLTLLFKRGFGQRYVAKPKNLDAPTKQKHIEYMKSQFAKATYDTYVRATTLEVDRRKSFEDYTVMDYCLAGDTKIATPTGFITIEELSNLGIDNEFIVYAYDHNKKQLIPAMARNAHQTQVSMTYKVTFDDGSEIVGTPNHRLMMRNGSFKRIDELQPNDSMMPFYRKDNFYPEKKYNHVYTCNPDVGWNGWVSEHKLIAEWKYDRKLKKSEVVHHLDFSGKNNIPENLVIMNDSDHKRYHCELVSKKNWKNPEIKERMMLGAKKGGQCGAKVSGDRNIGNQNPAYINVPFDNIIEMAQIHKTLKDTALALNVSYATIQKKTRDAGYKDWKTFCKAYNVDLSKYSTSTYCNGAPSQLPENRKRAAKNTWNHKVVSVEPYKVIPVYDLTVPGFKNFATDTVMSHNTPEIHSALDIYADESLTKDEYGTILNITCDNYRVRKILENLFEDILDIDHNLWQWIRQMCKYGNHFLLLDIREKLGVTGFLPIPTEELRREEAYDGDINSVKFIWDSQNLMFDSWQIAHFRMLSDMAKFPYGTSNLESARLIWKQLQLAEDAMLIYRITRAPERRVFYIDVGNIDPGDVGQYIADIKNSIKRTPMVNQSTGNMDFKYNAMAVDEDFFIPRRNDKNSEIDTLPGASNLDDIGDIEYIQAKLFAALKIPKAYLTFDDKINAKATLSSEDFRFARTINRIQQAAIATLTNIAIIHLYAMGFREKDQLTGFELELTNPNTQTEIEKMEIWSQKASVFDSLWDETTLSPISYVWGMKNIFDFSDDEIKSILEQQFLEGKMKLEIEKAGGNDPAEMMSGLTGMGSGGGQFGDKPPEPTNQQKKEPEKPKEPVSSGSPMGEHIRNVLGTIKTPVGPKSIIRNKSLINNSMSYTNTLKMLQNLDENLEVGQKKLTEINIGRNK